MSKRRFLIASLLVCMQASFGQKLRSYSNYLVFYSPEKGTYVETNITVLGKSLVFKNINKKFQASVLVGMQITQDGKIIESKKYNLLSNLLSDTLSKPNMIDIQRFYLKPGKYQIELAIKDNQSQVESKSVYSDLIVVNYDKAAVNLSKIELVEVFSKTASLNQLSKSGYDIIPYGVNYYPEDSKNLIFYTEAYGADTVLGKDRRFAFVYYIESYETIEKIEGFFGVAKQKAASVNVLMSQLNIEKLVSGNYNLVVELRDTASIVQAQQKLFFQRRSKDVKIELENLASIDPNATFASNYKNLDTLKEFIACLWPISTETERTWQMNQLKNEDAKLMQQYIFAFWKNRDEKAPEAAWIKYYKQVLEANKYFGCGKMKGYFTDRGRVYLQYGPPDSQQQVPNEPDSYPYEIWQYYRIVDPVTMQMQTNKRFIFYNKDLDGSCFELLHSDARGELKDNRWQMKLKQRSTFDVNLDTEKPKGNTYGSGADDLFNDPR